MSLIQPVVIIGAARSGTTVLAKALATHPDIAYIEEPNVIWRYSNARFHIDYLPAHLATKKVISYINKQFEEHVAKQGKSRLLEKTPANALRLGFVRKVLPDSKIIHLIRDGREVALSASRKWKSEFDRNSQLLGENIPFRQFRKQYIKLKQIPIQDFPYYLGEIFSILLFQLGLRERKIWGPRFPGIHELARVHSVLEVCALQWKSCLEEVERERLEINDVDFFEIKYEELCSSPAKHLKEILAFARLSEPDNFQDMISLIRPPGKSSLDASLSTEERKRITHLIGSTLRRAGYM